MIYDRRLFKCLIGFLFIPLLITHLMPVNAQSAATCGVVDALGYPVDNLVSGYDDFSLYRERFGGNHTGIDLAFDRWGDPIYAAARGLVTYADPDGWDTEKGVVIVSHAFPDGSTIYTVYGHVEQRNGIVFPAVGECVERGQIIAAVGWPSRGRPHLHYEIRNRLPNDGGPGYVTTNPLDEGWYSPLDFTALWQLRFNPAFMGYITFDLVPTLPPTQLESGTYVVASDNLITAVQPQGQILWRVQTDGEIDGLASLSGDRVVAHTVNGQTLTLQGGRYVAIWAVNSDARPFHVIGERLIFVMPDGSLTSYDPSGLPLWTLASGGEVVYFGSNGTQIAFASRTAGGVVWREVTAEGQVIAEVQLTGTPIVKPLSDGSWFVLDHDRLLHIRGSESEVIQNLMASGQAAQIGYDVNSNIYVYLDDANNTLVALNPTGEVRWRVEYPREGNFTAPLLVAGNTCRLYSLDVDGLLNVFDASDGRVLTQIQLYAGGRRTTRPLARLLRVDAAEQVYVSSGFLTLMFLDGNQLGEASC